MRKLAMLRRQYDFHPHRYGADLICELELEVKRLESENYLLQSRLQEARQTETQSASKPVFRPQRVYFVSNNPLTETIEPVDALHTYRKPGEQALFSIAVTNPEGKVEWKPVRSSAGRYYENWNDAYRNLRARAMRDIDLAEGNLRAKKVLLREIEGLRNPDWNPNAM